MSLTGNNYVTAGNFGLRISNSIMFTVPKDFDIPNGVEVEAKLVENGIFYEFVKQKKNFLILVKIF